MDISKLKVVELRAELAKRGLDQKGVKAVLVARLHEALEAEKGDAEEDEEEEQENEGVVVPKVQEEVVPSNAEPGGQDEVSTQSIQSSEPEITQPEEDSLQFSAFQEESESKLGYEVNEDSVAHPTYSETSSDVPAVADEASAQSFEYTDPKRNIEISGESLEPPPETVTGVLKQQEESKDNFQNYEDSAECLQEDTSTKLNYEEQSLDTWNQMEMNQHVEDSVQAFQMQDSSLQLDDSNAQDALESTQELSFHEETKSEIKADYESETNSNSESKMEPDVKSEDTDESETKAGASVKETESEMEVEHEKPSKEKDSGRERKNRWDDSRPSESTDLRKRQRSPTPDKNKTGSATKREDDEPSYDSTAVLLSWYDSDLNVLINKENFLSASVITTNGFGYIWGGVRATYGCDKGKIYYEVRMTERINVSHLEDEAEPNLLRVGWSIKYSSLQLGEESLSYAFECSGKIVTKCQFQNYGKSFDVNDVIGVYANFDSKEVEISFSINGEYQGVAYSVDREELREQPLFPHILSKNCSFEVNFGSEDPWAQILDDHRPIADIPLVDRTCGPRRLDKKDDCEVIMMIGLPGCGKTTWAKRYATEHKDKMFNILGISALIDKMTVMGAPRRKNYQGRWEVLISKCTKCLNTLMDMGVSRRRNYILDQTNVYPSAQRRKMRSFEGFVRRAVVMVPNDEDFKTRTSKREADGGKDIGETSILELKANFSVPERGELFDEVIFPDLPEDEAKKKVSQYNKEGNDHGFFSNAQQQKKYRSDDRGNDRRDFRNEGDRRMDSRGRPDNRGGHDGWRDRGFNHRRGDNRGWGPPRPGPGGWRNNRGGGGWRGGPPNRFGDRGGHGPRDMRDRNRDFRDRRDGSSGSGGKMLDRRSGDRDDKNRPKSMAPTNQQGWGNQSHGYNQGWGQNYHQGWGNWNQGYNQQPWKNYAQQSQQQSWGQSGWGQQGWGGQGWNQQYYNQYQQNWAQQPQAQGMSSGSTETSTTSTGSGSDTSSMAAAAYASYGQAGSWAGYTTMGSTGDATVGSSGGGNASSGTGSASSYSSQKQFRPDPRKT